jgi:hypothetical protein
MCRRGMAGSFLCDEFAAGRSSQPVAPHPAPHLSHVPCLSQVGWMMWNWMVSALATGASVVLYDGSPLIPTPNVLWDLVDRIG